MWVNACSSSLLVLFSAEDQQNDVISIDVSNGANSP